jgi:hypothetical protein
MFCRLLQSEEGLGKLEEAQSCRLELEGLGTVQEALVCRPVLEGRILEL